MAFTMLRADVDDPTGSTLQIDFPSLEAGDVVNMEWSSGDFRPYAAMTFAVSRVPWVESTFPPTGFILRSSSAPDAPTVADYAMGNIPRVNVDIPYGYNENFTISHEYGHAILLERSFRQMTDSDFDYTYNGSAGHTWNSQEFQTAAAIEGHGHFVTVATWNNRDLNAQVDGNCLLSLGGSEVTCDPDAYDQWFVSAYGAPVDTGSERDWMQFFWHFYADAGATGPLPTLDDVHDLMRYPTGGYVNAGFFNYVRSNAFGFESRFDEIAPLAGIDN